MIFIFSPTSTARLTMVPASVLIDSHPCKDLVHQQQHRASPHPAVLRRSTDNRIFTRPAGDTSQVYNSTLCTGVQCTGVQRRACGVLISYQSSIKQVRCSGPAQQDAALPLHPGGARPDYRQHPRHDAQAEQELPAWPRPQHYRGGHCGPVHQPLQGSIFWSSENTSIGLFRSCTAVACFLGTLN